MSLFQYADQQFPKRIMLVPGPGGRPGETVAETAITPGQLGKLDGNGKLVVHGTAGGYAEPLFPIEDALQANTLDTPYNPGDPVQTWHCAKGDVVYSWLADGQHVQIGDYLSSAGQGDFRKVTGSDVALAVALDALDLSVSSAHTHGRIRVRVL
jgi:hypothetical protein